MSRRGKMAAAGDDAVEHVTLDPLLPDIDAPDLSEAASAMARAWMKALRAGSPDLVTMLDVVRGRSREAFDWLVLNERAASGIAVSRDWLRPVNREPPDDDEKAAVAALCAGLEPVAGRGDDGDTPGTREPPTPTLRQLELLLATWRRDATPENGGHLRITMLERQIAALKQPAPEPVTEPETEGDDEPWVPSALAA